MGLDLVWSVLYQWINGPYRSIALMFIGGLCVVEALDLALAYLPKYIERKRADARWEQYKDLL